MQSLDTQSLAEHRDEMFRQLLDIAYAFLDAGMVFITSLHGLTNTELDQLKTISEPFNVRVIDLDKGSALSDMTWDASNTDALIADLLSVIE